jgi:hypothetical protein
MSNELPAPVLLPGQQHQRAGLQTLQVSGGDTDSDDEEQTAIQPAPHATRRQESPGVLAGHGQQSQEIADRDAVGNGAVSGHTGLRHQSGHASGRDPVSVAMVDPQFSAAAWSNPAQANPGNSTALAIPPSIHPQPVSNSIMSDDQVRARLQHVAASNWDDAMSAALLSGSAIVGPGVYAAVQPAFIKSASPQTFGQLFRAAALQAQDPGPDGTTELIAAFKHANHVFRELQALLKRMRDTNAAFTPFVRMVNTAVGAEQHLLHAFLDKVKTAGKIAILDVDALKLELKFLNEQLDRQLHSTTLLASEKSSKISARAAANDARCAAMTAQFAETWASLCGKLARVPTAMLEKLSEFKDPNVHYLQTLLAVIKKGCAGGNTPVTDLITLQGAVRELHAAMAAVSKHFEDEAREPLPANTDQTIEALQRAEATTAASIAKSEARLRDLKSVYDDKGNPDADRLLQWESQLQALQAVETELDALQKKRTEIMEVCAGLKRRVAYAKIRSMYGRPRGLVQCAELDTLTSAFYQDTRKRALQTNMFAGLVAQEAAAAAAGLKETTAASSAELVNNLLVSLEKLVKFIDVAKQKLSSELARTRHQVLQDTGAAMAVALATAPQADPGQNYYAQFKTHWLELCEANTKVASCMVSALQARLLKHAFATPKLRV